MIMDVSVFLKVTLKAIKLVESQFTKIIGSLGLEGRLAQPHNRIDTKFGLGFLSLFPGSLADL